MGENNMMTTRKKGVKQYEDFRKHLIDGFVSHAYIMILIQ